MNIGATSICLSGAGQHQINVKCRGITGDFLREGPWKNTGTGTGRQSSATCPLGTAMVSRFQTFRS